jgi:hypothetical protein
VTELSAADALSLRLAGLLLADHPGRTGASRPSDVAGVVAWFGAMQAQDLASAMWSLGARLPALTHAGIHDALERREALRTWPMRGTIHLVPPADARWMVTILGARPLAGAAKRRETIGLTEAAADAGVDALAEALAGGVRLRRAQCLEVLDKAGVGGPGQYGYHLLWYASQRGVICIAPSIGTEQTFALPDDWAPDQHDPDRDEALAITALRYFRSHGPASRADLARWAGITGTDAKKGIAGAGDALAAVTVAGTEMYLDAALLDAHPTGSRAGRAAVLALPGFDEFILGYSDRDLMLDPAHADAIVPGGNGVFQSTVVRGGRVVATWKRSTGKKMTTVDITPLVPLSAADRKRVDAAFVPYARYLDRTVTTRYI